MALALGRVMSTAISVAEYHHLLTVPWGSHLAAEAMVAMLCRFTCLTTGTDQANSLGSYVAIRGPDTDDQFNNQVAPCHRYLQFSDDMAFPLAVLGPVERPPWYLHLPDK